MNETRPNVIAALGLGQGDVPVVDRAVGFARRSGGKVFLVHVLPSGELRLNRSIYRPEESGGANVDHAREIAQKHVERLSRERARDVPTETIVRVESNTARAIVEDAERGQAGFIVVARRPPRLLAQRLFGSIGEQLLRASPLPVLHVPADADGQAPFRKILAPVSFGKRSEAVLALARRIALDSGASVTVVHVLPTDETFYQFRRETYGFAPDEKIRLVRAEAVAREKLEPFAREHLEGVTFDVRTHVSDDPTGTGIELEKEIGCDLLILATQGNRGFFRMVLGSAAERTVREVSCAVITVRSPDWE